LGDAIQQEAREGQGVEAARSIAYDPVLSNIETPFKASLYWISMAPNKYLYMDKYKTKVNRSDTNFSFSSFSYQEGLRQNAPFW